MSAASEGEVCTVQWCYSVLNLLNQTRKIEFSCSLSWQVHTKINKQNSITLSIAFFFPLQKPNFNKKKKKKKKKKLNNVRLKEKKNHKL